MPAKSSSDPKLKVEEVDEIPETPTKVEPVADTAVKPEVTSAPSETKTIDSFKFADMKTESVPAESVSEKAAESLEKSVDTSSTKSDMPMTESKTEEKSSKEWLNDIKPVDAPEEKSPTGKNILLVLIIFIILGGLVGGGIYYYQNSLNKTEDSSVEITSAQPTVPPSMVESTPTPEASSSAKLDSLKVNILNGSGKAGEAGKAADLLIAGGFVDANITKGNASSYDFTDTEVSVKGDADKTLFDQVKKLLKGYSVVKSATDLKSTSTYDVVVTVGSK